MKGSGAGSARVILVSLIVIALAAVPAALAAGQGNATWMDKRLGVQDLNVSSHGLNESSLQAQYPPTPAPVKVFEVKAGGPTMPGPRYMAFGPEVIGMSADPRALAVLFAVVVVALAGWYVTRRQRDGGKEEP